jgi:NADH-quinone oxidoreductase subunit M
MMLPWLVLIPAIGGVLAWVGQRQGSRWPRWIALATLGLDFALALVPWVAPDAATGVWLADFNQPWIPQLGIRFHLGLDGLSLPLVVLTLVLGMVSVAASWSEITERIGLFHLTILWALAGIIGVFLALDLLLFFLFWELMLIPMVFLIALWGHERRTYAATKFFLFTQGGGLLLLVAILALVIADYRRTGLFTFDYFTLAHTAQGGPAATWLMLGFFAAFAVKLPAVPLHTWLPDAHTEAPTAGSVMLAGLLLKTGAYGLLRFAIPLFPAQSHAFAPVAMVLGVIGILYGAVLAFAQDDIKRMVAYTSVSHLGFVLLGIYAGTRLALVGVIIQMLAHGLSTGGLFVLVGALQERLHTRDLRRMGGLWAVMPRLAAITLVFAIASLGLPGLGDFVGEFLVLLGTYPSAPGFAIAGSLGLVASALYALRLVQRALYGECRAAAPDLGPRHMAVMAVMMAGLVWFGLYPQAIFDIVTPVLASGAP